jgi:sphingolipid delta-4 desaturase
MQELQGRATPRDVDDDASGVRTRHGTTSAAPATPDALWHVRRQRAILHEHPEIRDLSGPDRWTAVWIVALVAAQWTLAFELRRAPAWLILPAILLVGAPIAHALGVLIHECAHNLVFRATWKNKVFAIIANLGIVGPGAITFRYQHLLHHHLLGDAREPDGGDTQAPTKAEIQKAGSTWWMRLYCYTFAHFLFDGRTGDRPPRDGWLVANYVLCIAAGGLIGLGMGLRALSYVMFSILFAFGPHPLGARRISEHWTLRRGQPTCSYYGPANWISFQVGHHVEHHDFPRVPWSRLRRLRAVAREHYQPLASFSSWTRLLLMHLFSPRWDRGHYVGFTDDYAEEEPPPT